MAAAELGRDWDDVMVGDAEVDVSVPLLDDGVECR